MNTFIQLQGTISDAYLTDTPPCFPCIEPNISLLESLASIPSNALIRKYITSATSGLVTQNTLLIGAEIRSSSTIAQKLVWIIIIMQYRCTSFHSVKIVSYSP